MIYRFRVDFESGKSGTLLIEGADRIAAARTLLNTLATNDKVHEGHPAVHDVGDGLCHVSDLPCPVEWPNAEGVWLWWLAGRPAPIVTTVAKGPDGGLTIHAGRGNPVGLEDWKQCNAGGVYVKVKNSL